jgi:pimeloyl-ACP methyl ester carboxylesterase
MKKFSAFILALLLTGLALGQTYQVGHTTITYTDPARSGRSIATEIYYPAATTGTSVPVSAGAFPVIVFGHGFVMTWDAYQNFWDDLVPQGYILVFPKTEGGFSPVHAEFGKDLAFLISKLQSESATNTSSLFYNHVNSKSAIMGHSMGGGSAFLGAEYNTSITTMVTFAAATTTPSSITAAQHVTIPALVFAGENDCVAPPPANQVKMYDSLASVCKTYISVKGAAHCEFANNNFNCAFGESTCSPAPTITRTQQQDAVSDFLKLWLEYYLKDNCSAWTTFNDSLSVSPRITHNQACSINNPVITQIGSVLTSTSASTYQWYWNGSIISGATLQNYTATAAGNYYVEVTYFNACPYPSNTINFTATGIILNSYVDTWSVFPNPAKDNMSIKFISKMEGEITVRIINIMGQEIFHRIIKTSLGANESEQFDLSGIDKGVYFIELSSAQFRYTEKIIKE